MSESACTVQRVSRQVIEHRLLTALEEGGVAAILSEQNLEDLINACEERADRYARQPKGVRCQHLADDMKQLMCEAFPPKTK